MSQILLIEPDKVLSKIFCQALSSAGHQAIAYSSGQSAIIGADEQIVNLVIMEIQLVGHSGIEFLYEFRSYIDWQNVPVIILSSVPPSEFKSSGSLLNDDLGIKKYLYKPQTSLQKLLEIVNDISLNQV